MFLFHFGEVESWICQCKIPSGKEACVMECDFKWCAMDGVSTENLQRSSSSLWAGFEPNSKGVEEEQMNWMASPWV